MTTITTTTSVTAQCSQPPHKEVLQENYGSARGRVRSSATGVAL